MMTRYLQGIALGLCATASCYGENCPEVVLGLESCEVVGVADGPDALEGYDYLVGAEVDIGGGAGDEGTMTWTYTVDDDTFAARFSWYL